MSDLYTRVISSRKRGISASGVFYEEFGDIIDDSLKEPCSVDKNIASILKNMEFKSSIS